MSIKPDRITSGQSGTEDRAFDRALRPQLIEDFIGQNSVKEQMQIFVEAARKRAEPLDHTLIFGPPGLGKTTLAYIVANEMQVGLKTTSGPVIEKAGELVALLSNLEENDVLFIDEIHRLSPSVEEILYPAMEDYRIDIVIGEGPAARSIPYTLKPFTLIGATTRAGLLTSPLRDRFGIVQRLEIARRARGTPRVANRLLRRVRDYAEVRADGSVSAETADSALDLLNVDQEGIDVMDRKLLLTILEKFSGGPVGLDSLAAAIGEERDTIEDVVEPYLIQQGYMMRTPRGRVATERAYHHFSLPPPPVPGGGSSQNELEI